MVDEGSTDATLETCRRYPVRVITSEGGRSTARNLGVRNAAGQFLMFLDSDMILHPQVVEQCVKACLQEHYDGMRIPTRHEVLEPKERCFWDVAGARDIELTAQDFPSDILFWSRNFVGNTGFPEGKSLGEDIHFQSALVRKGALIGTTCTGVTHIFLPDSSMSRVLRRSYGYGKLQAAQNSAMSLRLITTSISVVGSFKGWMIVRSLMQRRSLRLCITMPIYLLLKHLGFALGYLVGLGIDSNVRENL